MPPLLILLLIVFSCTLFGSLLIGQWLTAGRYFTGTWFEFLFAGLTVGVVTWGWIAFVLAELGFFSVAGLGIIWLATCFFLGRRLLRHKNDLRPWFSLCQAADSVPLRFAHFQSKISKFIPNWVENLIIAGWILLAGWLFFRPHEFVIGAADAGVYVNLAAQISNHGRIIIHDELLAGLDEELTDIFLQDLGENSFAPHYLLPGFYVTDLFSGEITPQFYHLHPTWQAVAYDMGQSTNNRALAALSLTGLWALLGALAVYLTVRQFLGWPIALLALLGLSLNGLQIWFARYPTTEMLSQYLLWAGLWSLGAWLSQRRPGQVWALLAGACLGQFFLVRIDTVVIMPVIGLLILWLWLTDENIKNPAWFIVPFLGMVMHAFIHGYWQSRPYFFDLFGFGLRLLQKNWFIPALGTAVGLVILWLIARYRHQYSRVEAQKGPVLLGFILLVLIMAGFAWFVRPVLGETMFRGDLFSPGQIPIVNHENFIRFGWYLTPLGIWSGVFGICLLLWQLNRKTAVMLGIGLTFAVLFIWNIRLNPLQIYAMRRYVSAVMPLFIVGSVAILGWLITHRHHVVMGLGIFLALVWLAGLSWSARGLITQIDYNGVIRQLNELDSQLEEDAILLFNDQAQIGQGDQIGTPLRFLYGHEVFTLRTLSERGVALLDVTINRWLADGRPVYWVDTPNGQIDYRPEADMQLLTPYQIDTAVLERTYERRPMVINPQRWSGDIFRLHLPEEE